MPLYKVLPKLDIVTNDEGDWAALYIDGKLFYQGHNVETQHVLEALKIPHTRTWDADAEATGFQFPDRLEDVVGGTTKEFNK